MFESVLTHYGHVNVLTVPSVFSPDLLCVKNVCCLTIVMNVNVSAVPSGKTCYVSEFLLPQCCHMNVPAVPSVVPKPVM